MIIFVLTSFGRGFLAGVGTSTEPSDGGGGRPGVDFNFTLLRSKEGGITFSPILRVVSVDPAGGK